MRHVFIINPAAGKSDRSREFSEHIKSVFKGREEKYEIHVTTHAGHATEIAREAAKAGHDIRLYAIGGDGTLNEVVAGAYGHDNASVTCIPIGTGNDFIKAFHKDAASYFSKIEDLVEGADIVIDLICINEKICINIASAGLDANIAWGVKAFKNLVSGNLAYIMSLFMCMLTKVKSRLNIKIDDTEVFSGDFLFAVAGNGRYYGGGFNPTPNAGINDGLLDFLLIRSVSRFKIVSLMGKYKTGEHLSFDFCTLRQGRKMEISADQPIAVQFDGEVIKTKQAVFELINSGMRFTVPSILSNNFKKR